jgi:putative heme-binding domain-containing protein
VRQSLSSADKSAASKTAEALGNTGRKEAVPLLLPMVENRGLDILFRKQAVRSLAQIRDGASALLELAREGKLPEDVAFTASIELNSARWPEIKQKAVALLPLPQGQNSTPLPSIGELVKMKGDPRAGARVFSNPTAACATCHRVGGEGVELGPDLSEIGTKLGKEALYESILDPNAGISFGYEAWQLTLASDDEAYGLIVSETADELAVKAANGIINRYKKSEVTKREQMKLSMMPVGLQQAMTTQELVDLVEYLASLRKAAK